MHIVKNIAEAHGGMIWVKSKFGKGTTIKFALKRTLQPELTTILQSLSAPWN